MIRVAVLIVGAFILLCALVIVMRRRGDYSGYGGRIAFGLHIAAIVYVAISLILFASVNGVSATTLAYGMIALGLLDLVFGIVARRASAQRRRSAA